MFSPDLYSPLRRTRMQQQPFIFLYVTPTCFPKNELESEHTKIGNDHEMDANSNFAWYLKICESNTENQRKTFVINNLEGELSLSINQRKLAHLRPTVAKKYQLQFLWFASES